MFSSNDLEAMTNQAKERLTQQLKEDEGETTNTGGEDLYAEFREAEGATEAGSTEEDRDYSIFTSPDKYEENPSIDNSPGEDYYSQERQELNPYDEPLFENGPTKTQVDSWKKQWEGYDVFVTEIIEQYFIFRTLNRFEYKQLVALKNVDPIQREEIICETVVLWPEEYKWDMMATDKAGIPSTLAQVIMEKSGFTKDYGIQVL